MVAQKLLLNASVTFPESVLFSWGRSFWPRAFPEKDSAESQLLPQLQQLGSEFHGPEGR